MTAVDHFYVSCIYICTYTVCMHSTHKRLNHLWMFSPQRQQVWLSFLSALQSVCVLLQGFQLFSSWWEQNKIAVCMSWWAVGISSLSAAGHSMPLPACQPPCHHQIPPLWPGWAALPRCLHRSSGLASCECTYVSGETDDPEQQWWMHLVRIGTLSFWAVTNFL